MHFAARRHGRNPRAVCALTPHARSNSRAGHASAPAEKHCAAQAEYGRLAAQAYSPSDAMSQARFCLDGVKKVQRRLGTNSPGNLPAETGPCGRRICSRGWGGPPDFPRRRRPRCIAPCGGVVWLGGAGPLHPRHAGVMPAAIGTDMNAAHAGGWVSCWGSCAGSYASCNERRRLTFRQCRRGPGR
jgi:hypothetical protein